MNGVAMLSAIPKLIPPIGYTDGMRVWPKLLRLHYRSYTALIADHLSSRRSSPIPFFIFGVDLTQLVRGVERLNQPLTQVYTHNARGVDKVSVRNGHMSEGIACEMAARLQLAVSLRDQVLHNRPIFNPNHWFAHTALHPSFRTGHWYHRANVCRTGFALLVIAIEIPMQRTETQGLFPEAINGRKFLPTFQSYLENVEKSATRPKMLSKCLEQASPKTEEASCVGGRSFVLRAAVLRRLVRAWKNYPCPNLSSHPTADS